MLTIFMLYSSCRDLEGNMLAVNSVLWVVISPFTGWVSLSRISVVTCWSSLDDCMGKELLVITG